MSIRRRNQYQLSTSPRRAHVSCKPRGDIIVFSRCGDRVVTDDSEPAVILGDAEIRSWAFQPNRYPGIYQTDISALVGDLDSDEADESLNTKVIRKAILTLEWALNLRRHGDTLKSPPSY